MLYGHRIVAVCISKLTEEIQRQFIEALAETLRPHGWNVIVFMTGTDLYSCTPSNKGEETVFELMDMSVIDAVILFDNMILDKQCRENIIMRAQKADVPLILVNGNYKGCCCLNFDNSDGFAQIVRHLVEVHNVRDFHMIAGNKDNAFSDERIDVMRNIMKEYDIPFGDDCVSYGDFWSDPARLAVCRLIEQNRLPRAIVCANDTMALAVCLELRQHGCKIPDDVIVTGFDGIDEVWHSDPKITSAFNNFSLLGKEAAKLCIQSGEGTGLPENVSLPPELLIQESCGCCPQTERDATEFFFRTNNSFNLYQYDTATLNEISARIQLSDTLEQVAKELHSDIIYCLQVLLKKECIDFSLDPTIRHSDSAFGDEMYLLMDTQAIQDEGRYIKISDMINNIQGYLDSGYPIIILALHHIDLPLGYLCYTYENYSLQNYMKMYQTAMFIGTAIAGFRSRHYQQHLRSVLEETYRYDALTGLVSRSAFLRQTELMTGQPKQPLTVVLLDLDGLKYINDTFGHFEGDYAISAAAGCLHRVCSGGICTRYGGDEFVALLKGEADCENLRRALAEQLDACNSGSGKPYTISASIGIYTGAGESIDVMISKADEIMYEEKSHKPNRRR